MRRALIWTIAALMVLSLGALTSAKVSEEQSVPMKLVVKPYAELGVEGEAFYLTLDQPRENGEPFKSEPVGFTVKTNTDVLLRITEDFTDGLREYFRLNEDDLKRLLNPRISLVHDAGWTTLPVQLPGAILRNLEPGTYSYTLMILLDWAKDADWWRIAATEEEMGYVYITVEGL